MAKASGIRDPPDRDLWSGFRACIARQALGPGETKILRALHRRSVGSAEAGLVELLQRVRRRSQ